MRNFKITLEYDGTSFVGWQVQKKGASIQGLLQDTLKKLTKEKVTVIGSGRTDSGVHALGQVAHFKTHSTHSPEKIQTALNALLPSSVVIRKIEVVSLDFHAQLHAVGKLYAYLVLNDPVPSVFLDRYSWQIPRPLDWDAVHAALEALVGEHDFKSFQSVGTAVKSSVRKIHWVGVEERFKDHPNLYAIKIESNGFLKQMVRNIVGTVVQVGQGRLKLSDIKKILAAKDRKKAGPAAPGRGLFLVEVKY